MLIPPNSREKSTTGCLTLFGSNLIECKVMENRRLRAVQLLHLEVYSVSFYLASAVALKILFRKNSIFPGTGRNHLIGQA